jgi:hypothetical protein
MLPETASFHTIWLSTFGLALAVVGLGWLLVGSWLGPRWRWRVLVGLGCSSALGAAVARDLGAPDWLWQPVLALVPVGLVAALACSAVPALVGRTVAGLARCAPVQALVLLTVGVALAGTQLYRLDQELTTDTDLAESELSLFSEPTFLESLPARKGQTDAGRSVPLFACRSNLAHRPGDGNEEVEARYLRGLRLERKLIQTAQSDPRYNCHGWVFAAGRYWVKGAAVEGILQDNRYRRTRRPGPGDLVVFRNSTGQVTHSGLVHSVSANGLVLLESKWGQLGRYIHSAGDHSYRGHEVTYYRSKRGSHQLRGVSEDTQPAVPSDATWAQGGSAQR